MRFGEVVVKLHRTAQRIKNKRVTLENPLFCNRFLHNYRTTRVYWPHQQ